MTTSVVRVQFTDRGGDDATGCRQPRKRRDDHRARRGHPEFSTLLAAVEAAGLAETLAGDGPFTVFAPTDAAFAELPAGTVDTLLQPANKDQLAAILTYHVVPAEVMAADVEAGEVPTVNSAPFTVALNGQAVEITDGQGNQANVIETDIDASNGVVHVIDAVLLPAA